VVEHRPKLAAFTVLAAVVLVAGFAAVGYLMAQEGKYSHISSAQTGDAEVVAVVNGIEVTRGQVRKTPAILRENQPNLTEHEAIILSIVGQIDRYVLLSEVQRRGLMPTDEEAREFMEPHKKACLDNPACRDSITDQGESLEDYWDRVAPYYREDLGITRLHQALLTEVGLPPEKGTSNERADALAREVARLRADANIKWQDQRLADFYDFYNEALSHKGEEFRREQYEKAKSAE
jgi:hypothetical protein